MEITDDRDAIARDFPSIAERVNRLGNQLRRRFHAIRAPGNSAALMGEIGRGADEAFRLAGDCDRLLERLHRYPFDQFSLRLCDEIGSSRNRALRYSRETLVYAAPGPVAVIPLAHNRTFLRDGRERMYFLALHSLPTAYDFFCTTYTETPPDYRQEAHLHRDSTELTLVLEGEADCVWYEEGPGGSLVEAGRRTVGSLGAFRIPPRLPHAIHNPTQPNRNLTVKLSPFIEDRIGERDWRFSTERKQSGPPVVVERGSRSDTDWGTMVRYEHGHRRLRFRYCVAAISPDRRYRVATESCVFLFKGTIRLSATGLAAPVLVESGAIIRIVDDAWAELTNIGAEDALLFSVEELDYRHFLSHAAEYTEYPTWLIEDIRQTLSTG